MPSGTAPSAGTKVTMGKDAPYASEATGAVASDSLAAESQAFRQNNEGAPQAYPHESLTGASSKSSSTPAAASTGSAPASAGTAPSYVQNVYHQDQSGPHGKNIHHDESIATEDKNKNASFSAEIGSENDPARLAEKKFALAGQAPATSIGERQHTVNTETRFDALGSNESA